MNLRIYKGISFCGTIFIVCAADREKAKALILQRYPLTFLKTLRFQEEARENSYPGILYTKKVEHAADHSPTMLSMR